MTTRSCALCHSATIATTLVACVGGCARAYCTDRCRVADWEGPDGTNHLRWCKQCGEEGVHWAQRRDGVVALTALPAKMWVLVERAAEPRACSTLQFGCEANVEMVQAPEQGVSLLIALTDIPAGAPLRVNPVPINLDDSWMDTESLKAQWRARQHSAGLINPKVIPCNRDGCHCQSAEFWRRSSEVVELYRSTSGNAGLELIKRLISWAAHPELRFLFSYRSLRCALQKACATVADPIEAQMLQTVYREFMLAYCGSGQSEVVTSVDSDSKTESADPAKLPKPPLYADSDTSEPSPKVEKAALYEPPGSVAPATASGPAPAPEKPKPQLPAVDIMSDPTNRPDTGEEPVALPPTPGFSVDDMPSSANLHKTKPQLYERQATATTPATVLVKPAVQKSTIDSPAKSAKPSLGPHDDIQPVCIASSAPELPKVFAQSLPADAEKSSKLPSPMDGRGTDEVGSSVPLPVTCAFCYVDLPHRAMRCTRCHARVYCSKQCQKLDWSTNGQRHAKWCGRCGEEGSHWELRRKPSGAIGAFAREGFEAGCRVLVDRVLYPDVDRRIIEGLNPPGANLEQKVGLNAFTFPSFGGSSPIAAVGAKLSWFDHCCDANVAVAVLDNLRVLVGISTRRIAPGEELTVTFVPFQGEQSTIDERSSFLREHWGITCPTSCVCQQPDFRVARIQLQLQVDSAFRGGLTDGSIAAREVQGASGQAARTAVLKMQESLQSAQNLLPELLDMLQAWRDDPLRRALASPSFQLTMLVTALCTSAVCGKTEYERLYWRQAYDLAEQIGTDEWSVCTVLMEARNQLLAPGPL